MAISSGIAGSHGGRSVDVRQTGTNTHAVAQVSDLKEAAAPTAGGSQGFAVVMA